MREVKIIQGDSRDVLKTIADNSIDSVVTDPPYALVSIQKRFGKPGSAPAKGNDAYMRASKGFMSVSWDTGETAFDPEFWAEVLRVLKPGGHLIAASGTRTYHRLAVAIEDAGFEVRDMISWLYGSGFPKSHDVSKGIDKMGPPDQAPFAEFAAHYEAQRKAKGLTHAKVCAAGGWHGAVNHGGSSVNWANGYGMPTVEQWAVLQPLLELDEKWSERVQRVQYEREVLGLKPGSRLAVAPGQENDRSRTDLAITAAGSDAARRWEGWGTALKPACEPWVLARKPLESTVAANVMAHGTGALNIDGCRISWPDGVAPEIGTPGWGGPAKKLTAVPGQDAKTVERTPPNKSGRWPANVIHDGSEEVVEAFPAEAGAFAKVRGTEPSGVTAGIYGEFNGRTPGAFHGDSGSAARFFYTVEKDSLCDLCHCPLGRKNGIDLPCNATNAEQSSPIQDIQAGGSARCDAADSSPLGREGKALASRSHANGADDCLSPRHLASADIAAAPAQTPELLKLAHNVECAANLCASCATSIAQSLVAMRQGQDPASLQCPAYIGARNWQILIRNLALYVEGRENTDTILTTQNLKTLLGSVFHAIGESTKSERGAARANTGSGPARFHYSSKADADDRLGSKHPTVKPIDLMRYLVRLVTPPGGVVLDPFAGSGSTGVAAMLEGFESILIEREADYVADIKRKVAFYSGEGRLAAQEKGKVKAEPVNDLPLFGGEAA